MSLPHSLTRLLLSSAVPHPNNVFYDPCCFANTKLLLPEKNEREISDCRKTACIERRSVKTATIILIHTFFDNMERITAALFAAQISGLKMRFVTTFRFEIIKVPKAGTNQILYAL